MPPEATHLLQVAPVLREEEAARQVHLVHHQRIAFQLADGGAAMQVVDPGHAQPFRDDVEADAVVLLPGIGAVPRRAACAGSIRSAGTVMALDLAGRGLGLVDRLHAVKEAVAPMLEGLRVDALVVLHEVEPALQPLMDHAAVVLARQPSLGLVVAPSNGRPNLSSRPRSTTMPVGDPANVFR